MRKGDPQQTDGVEILLEVQKLPGQEGERYGSTHLIHSNSMLLYDVLNCLKMIFFSIKGYFYLTTTEKVTWRLLQIINLIKFFI